MSKGVKVPGENFQGGTGGSGVDVDSYTQRLLLSSNIDAGRNANVKIEMNRASVADQGSIKGTINRFS